MTCNNNYYCTCLSSSTSTPDSRDLQVVIFDERVISMFAHRTTLLYNGTVNYYYNYTVSAVASAVVVVIIIIRTGKPLKRASELVNPLVAPQHKSYAPNHLLSFYYLSYTNILWWYIYSTLITCKIIYRWLLVAGGG